MTRPMIMVVLGFSLAACRSYSYQAIQDTYAKDLNWTGHDEAVAARQPSAALWERVEQNQFLTLRDAFQISLTQSERIARAAEGFVQSLILQDRALSAFLPTVGVQATEFLQNDVPSSSSTGLSSLSTERKEFKVTYTQPLFRGLRDFAALRQVEATLQQRKSFFDTERRLLFQIVAQAFYNRLFLDHQVTILKDSLKNSSERLREMRARQAQGIARKTEVLLIETQVASDEATLARALQASEIAGTQLAFLLGKPLRLGLRDDVPDVSAPAEVAPLITEALAQRSDLKEREAAIGAAVENISIIRGEHLPALDFTANYYLYREGFTSFQQHTDWDVLLTLSMNLFKGGDIRLRTLEAESQYRVALLNFDELRRQIATDVTNALLTLRSDSDLIKTLETRERTSGENYNQVASEYRQGIAGVSNLEVLIAQNQYLSAQLELDRQRFQRKLDWFQLENAKGNIPVR